MSDKQYPRARKRFGQNFLQDDAIIDHIIAVISPEPGEHVVEIGPGRAALTEPLLNQCDQLDVIELDRDLVPLLEKKLGHHPHLRIYQADALTFDYQRLQSANELLRVVGNLPYNITTPLLFHLLEQAHIIQDMCFMLQKEVVERICAAPGTKQYGRLSIMMQYQCYAEMMFIVPPEAFDPPPKVDSAIIYLQPLKEKVGGLVNAKTLNALVTQAFSQRRKTISNTLKKMVSLAELESISIDSSQRPETISVLQYVKLAQLIESK
jgi:16S rRNA (adenine1518-N6/adenine1519-N6)-dimethyltransferase